MQPKRNYYLNDYFDLFNLSNKEKEYMKTDIFEHDNKYYIEIDIPGIKKHNIHISYNKGYLTIKAVKNAKDQSPNSYIRRERLYGEIQRSFYIGIKNEKDILAKYQEGILQISFPKKDVSTPETKNITVF